MLHFSKYINIVFFFSSLVFQIFEFWDFLFETNMRSIQTNMVIKHKLNYIIKKDLWFLRFLWNEDFIINIYILVKTFSYFYFSLSLWGILGGCQNDFALLKYHRYFNNFFKLKYKYCICEWVGDLIHSLFSNSIIIFRNLIIKISQ